MKAQSAVEYLTTYGWAILIIAVVLGAIFALNLFNPSQFTTQECLLPADFNCLSYFMNTNGLLNVNLQQATEYPINITSVGCSANVSASIVTNYVPNIYLPISDNYTFNIPCYGTNGQIVSLSPGAVFSGSLQINYTDTTTGFPKTDIGKIIVKAS